MSNPFAILELPATATPIEIERRKQKLLGMIELGLDGAGGLTAEEVRDAADRLSRPEQRLAWELWTPRGDGSHLDQALELHAAIKTQIDRGVEVTAAELDELGLAWDLAFESEDVDDRAAERAARLGYGGADRAVTEFTEELEDALAAIVASAGSLDLDELESEILADVAQRHADDEIERLELACERYVESDGAGIHEWSALTSQYWAVVKGRGDHVRSTAFYAVYYTLVNHAVELHDEARYEEAARIFTWVSERAEAIGDDDAAETQRGNAELCTRKWLHGERPVGFLSQMAENQRSHTVHRNASGWTWVWIVAVVLVAMLRLGRACDSRSPSYYPPPPPPTYYQPDLDQLNRNLERSIQNLEYYERYRDHRDPLAPLPELPALPETGDGQRIEDPPAVPESD